jgi:hypothetical protein
MDVVIPERYRQLRLAIPFDRISVGYAGISLVTLQALELAQRDYGVIPDEEWAKRPSEWLHIGTEEVRGDPIFIDTDDREFPVYTAAPDSGWTPKLLAFTFSHFAQILMELRALARGRESPLQIQHNPVSPEESEQFIEFIRRGSPDVDVTFWRGLYETEN